MCVPRESLLVEGNDNLGAPDVSLTGRDKVSFITAVPVEGRAIVELRYCGSIIITRRELLW